MPLSSRPTASVTQGVTVPMTGAAGEAGLVFSDITLQLFYDRNAYFIRNKFDPSALALAYSINEYWVDESSTIPAA